MRRLASITVVLVLAVLCTLLLPLLQILAFLLGLLPGLRGAVPTAAFMVGYLWCETIGIVCAGYISLRHRDPTARFAANFKVQCWWASSLKRLAGWLYQLNFTLHGTEHLEGGPALVLPRHTSIADTVLPVTYFAKPFNTHLRYVMKRELLYDPCLDIYGHRLPNFFIDRSGVDSERELEGVRSLTETLSPNEGMLIYPEGTRYSPEKHQALVAKPGQSPELLAQLQRWPDLLPPRLGGTLAMLQANPGKDLLLMAHVGFEGSSRFSTLINGSWRYANVHIEFWRVPFGDVPTERSAQQEFLFTQWDRMQDTVSRLKMLQQTQQ